MVKDAVEIAGSKTIQKAAQQTSAAVGNQTVQEMLSSGPNGLYSKLKRSGQVLQQEMETGTSSSINKLEKSIGPVNEGGGRTGAYNPNYSGATEKGLGKLEGMEINVSQKGLDIVKNHISTFDPYAPNQAMIQRIESAMENGKSLAGADASFYMHEVSEFTKMKKGMDYDSAHELVLQKYKVSRFSVYHPDVIKSMPEEFNSSWYKFWGLEK